MADIVSYSLAALIVVAIVSFVLRTVRFKSLSGALLGAQVASTAGHAIAASELGFAVEARVHRLCSPVPYRAVGLELVERVAGSYRVRAVTLSVAEAHRLAELLIAAANAS